MEIEDCDFKIMVKAAETAKALKIESVIIESGKIRAMNEARTVVMFQDKNVPDFDFGSICIGRISTFLSRVDMVPSGSITAILDDANEFIKQLKFSAKRVKVEFRAANPLTVVAPKNVNDAACLTFTIDSEVASLISKAAASTKSESITFTKQDDKVIFVMKDVNRDSIECEVSSLETLDGTIDDFNYQYPLDVVLPLIKLSGGVFKLTKKGMLNTVVNSFNVYVPKEIN